MTFTVEQLEPRLALHGTLFEAQLTGSRDDALHCLLDGCPLIPAALPHQDNLEMQAEHLYLFSLFPVSEADGVNRIVVPAGETLVIDECLTAEWIRVQGTLEIREGAEIRVDTIVTDPASHFEATGGTITFVDGALRSDDPLQLSRGLIAHGSVSITGVKKSPFVDATSSLSAGDSGIEVAEADFWAVGDRLVIPGTSATANEDDERTIAAIDGNTITLDRPLDFEHPELLGHKPVVANLTRSVVFQSENATGVRGHVMMMHNASRVSIEYAAFNDLGRTRADEVVTDPTIEGAMGDNPRGRYSLHFHRGGTTSGGAVVGAVVTGARKLAVVNHSSNVIVDKSISYKFDGSGFFTETGAELGEFRNNLAIRTTRISNFLAEHQIPARRDAQDFGHSGVGFWLQSGSVTLRGNAAYGVNTGVMLLAEPLKENGSFVTHAGVDVGAVPFTFEDTLVVGATAGIVTNHLGGIEPPRPLPSRITNADLINVHSGIALLYTAGVVIENVRAVGVMAANSVAFGGNDAQVAITYRNVSAEKFVTGFQAPAFPGFVIDDHLVVEGASLACLVGVLWTYHPRSVGIRTRFEDVSYLPLPPEYLVGTGLYDYPWGVPAGAQFEEWRIGY